MIINKIQQEQINAILTKYREITKGYCVFETQRWAFDHTKDLSTIFSFRFWRHDELASDNLNALLMEAHDFIKNLPTNSVHNPV